MKKGRVITEPEELSTYPEDTLMSITYAGKTLKKVKFMWLYSDEITYLDLNGSGYHTIPVSSFESATLLIKG